MSDPRENSNSTNYIHPQESNLLNIHKAMEYNDAGQPVLRTKTSIVGDIIIEGDVNIPGVVTVDSSPENPVHVHVTESTPLEIKSLPEVSVYTDSGNVLNIAGSVSVDSLPEVEIKNDIDNPIPVSANTSGNSDTNPIFVKGTSDSSFFNPTQIDAFGRLRVSQPYTLFDSFHRYQDNGKISQAVNGLGSGSSHSVAEGCITATIGQTAGAYVHRESSRVFAYQPGKSFLILETFVFGPSKLGLRTRYGYFDSNNGFYLERNGNTINFVKRTTSLTGSMSEIRIEKSDWNINTLETLNLEVAQIFFIEIEWLGVGSVKMGFVINGEFVPCHRWDWANKDNSNTTYMATACLPIRAELENTNNTDSSSTLKLICATVLSEGGYELRGRSRSAGQSLSSPYTLTSQNTVYPIFSMRLKSSRLGGLVLPKTFTLSIDKQANYRYMIVIGGTTTGGAWVDAGASDSSVEYNLTATSIAGGNISDIGFINASNQSSISPSLAAFPFQYQLERNTFTSTSTEFTICIETDASTGPKSWCSVNWEEIT